MAIYVHKTKIRIRLCQYKHGLCPTVCFWFFQGTVGDSRLGPPVVTHQSLSAWVPGHLVLPALSAHFREGRMGSWWYKEQGHVVRSIIERECHFAWDLRPLFVQLT